MSPRLKRVLAWQREAEPLFPITSFVPDSKCPHHGPIREGSVFECMCCSRGGRDKSPMLAKCYIEDPNPPTPGPKAPATAAKAGKKTRKQNRAAIYKIAVKDHLNEKAA
jgi:hypothetical protein